MSLSPEPLAVEGVRQDADMKAEDWQGDIERLGSIESRKNTLLLQSSQPGPGLRGTTALIVAGPCGGMGACGCKIPSDSDSGRCLVSTFLR